MQALLGFVSESRWLRVARKSLRGLFPYLPSQSGYSKRLRTLAVTMAWLIRMLAMDTSAWHDDVLGGGFHPGGVRPVQEDCPPQRPGRIRPVRLLRQPLPLRREQDARRRLAGQRCGQMGAGATGRCHLSRRGAAPCGGKPPQGAGDQHVVRGG